MPRPARVAAQATEAGNALLIGSDRIAYEVRRSPRRRTLVIEVHRDLRVVVRAPARADARFIAERVAERGGWISRTLERFRHVPRQAPQPLQYVDGETHFFLGEPYRLEVCDGRQAGVTIDGGVIRVALRGALTPARARRALEAWYRRHLLAETAEILLARMDYFSRRGHVAPAVRIRRMGTRWGSLAGGRRMTLNLALIRASRECLEYVVVHELCHLEHRGHGRSFYRLMDQLMPDWPRCRKHLAVTESARWEASDT